VLAEADLVCVAAKGQLPRKNVKKGSIALTDLAQVPVVGLDMTDPLGIMLAQACRDAGSGLDSRVSVQSYHGALALARHGHGAAIVDGCTAISASREDVDVLALEPRIAVPVHALVPASKPASVVVRAFMRAVQQVLTGAGGHISKA
jgi:DNA-binding transcriptional LysR family regulator